MKQTIDAVYENGTLRPLQPLSVAEGQRVKVTITCDDGLDPLRLAADVYEGLSNQEIEEIERIALHRSRFFSDRSAD